MSNHPTRGSLISPKQEIPLLPPPSRSRLTAARLHRGMVTNSFLVSRFFFLASLNCICYILGFWLA
uniref:Uncharacterized protein n=1 Tax=Triticum urartu TaxID=4572 RepID=A0A8R7TRN8_TRIUA